MLKNIDLSRKLEKDEYKKLMDEFSLSIGELERTAKDLKIPVIVIFEGWEAAGKGTLINDLILPMDPRGFTVTLFTETEKENIFKPFMYKYWEKLPAKGRISIFDKSWYNKTINQVFNSELTDSEKDTRINDINSFEKLLIDDNNVIIKFFIHISKKEQKKRFEKLEDNSNTSWRVTKSDWKQNEKYDKYLDIYEDILSKTDTGYAPWNIIEAEDKRFATVKIFDIFTTEIKEKIEELKNLKSSKTKTPDKIEKNTSFNTKVLESVNPDKEITKEEYTSLIKEYQAELRELEYKLYKERIPAIITFEGWDAAGKGGAIKRLTEELDPRGYEVIPIAAPNDIERAHHYLWRFWVKFPKAGHLAIFDRTWYGRVMVERIEGFCAQEDWKRAYKEINDMERQLTDFGTILVKFWLNIDKEEQLKRFEERKNNAFKNWKLTDEDWRNREKWDVYKVAVDEMIYRTSTSYAPWTIVEANNKYFARLKVIKTVIDSIKNKI